MKKNVFQIFLSFTAFVYIFAQSGVLTAFESRDRGSGGMPGIPISAFMRGGGTEDDIFPAGTRVVRTFIQAWSVEDFETMYSLLSIPEDIDYPFEEARFDFQFMEYRPYEISSVRKEGDNYEYLLSYGDWRHGDKDIKKIVICGENALIVLQRNRSVFRQSLASYF